jgi:hypothetical protein
MKMKMVYNNNNNVERLLSNGQKLLSHLGHLGERLGRVLFEQVHLSTHLSAICADVPRRFKLLFTAVIDTVPPAKAVKAELIL